MIPTGEMLIILGLMTPKLLTLPGFYALFEKCLIPTGEMLIILGLMTPKLLTLPALYAIFEKCLIPTGEMLIMSIMSKGSLEKSA